MLDSEGFRIALLSDRFSEEMPVRAKVIFYLFKSFVTGHSFSNDEC